MLNRQQQYGRSTESMPARQQQYGGNAESMPNRQQQYGGSIESMPAQRQRSLGSMASSRAQHQRSGESMVSLTAQHQRSLESVASSMAQYHRSLESMASSMAQHQRSGESMHRITSYSRYFGPNLGPPGDESPATRGPSSTVESEAPAFSPAPDRISTASPNLYKAYDDPNSSSSLFSTPSIRLAGDSEDPAFCSAHISPDTSPASSRAATLLLTSDSESEQEPELLDLSAVLARSELKTLPYSDPHYSAMTSSAQNHSEAEPQVTPVDTRKLFSLPGHSTIVHSQYLEQDDLVQAQCHSIPPPEEKEYPSEAHFLKAIDEWGHVNGCQLVKTGYRYRERKLTSIQLKCKRNGVARKRDRPRFTEAKPRQRTTMKIGCRTYVTAKRCGESDRWRVHCNEFASLHHHAPDHVDALTSHRLKGLESFIPEIAREAFPRTPAEVMASLLQEPARLQDIQSTRSTTHSAGHGESSTRRNRSQFELVDENLSAAPTHGSPPRFRMPGRPETHWRVVYQDPPNDYRSNRAALQRVEKLREDESQSTGTHSEHRRLCHTPHCLGRCG